MTNRIAVMTMAGLLSFGVAAKADLWNSIGTAAGAVVGGLIGNEVCDNSFCTIAGGAIGAVIGNELTENDRRVFYGAQAQVYTAPLNQPIYYSIGNQRSQIVAVAEFRDRGRDCRIIRYYHRDRRGRRYRWKNPRGRMVNYVDRLECRVGRSNRWTTYELRPDLYNRYVPVTPVGPAPVAPRPPLNNNYSGGVR